MKKDAFYIIILFVMVVLNILSLVDRPENTNEKILLETYKAYDKQQEYIYTIYEMEKDIAYLRQHIRWDDTTYDDSCLSIYEDDISVTINEARMIYESTYEQENP